MMLFETHKRGRHSVTSGNSFSWRPTGPEACKTVGRTRAGPWARVRQRARWCNDCMRKGTADEKSQAKPRRSARRLQRPTHSPAQGPEAREPAWLSSKNCASKGVLPWAQDVTTKTGLNSLVCGGHTQLKNPHFVPKSRQHYLVGPSAPQRHPLANTRSTSGLPLRALTGPRLGLWPVSVAAVLFLPR